MKPVVLVGDPWPDELREVCPPRQWRPVYIILLLAFCALTVHSVLSYATGTDRADIIREVLGLAKAVLLMLVGWIVGRQSRADDP